MSLEQDWTDPEFVTGAVYAQIEDLSYEQKVNVLMGILNDLMAQAGEAPPDEQ